MARKSASGKFIISASEVGSFVVCQEAWRLRELENAKKQRADDNPDGRKSHKDWANELDYYHFLKRAWPHILLLILLSIFAKIVFYLEAIDGD